MSALQFQIEDSKHQPQSGISSVKFQHHQLTSLLVHAISLVESDEKSALEFVRRASALAGRLELFDQNAEQSIRGLAPWQSERVRRHVEKNYASRIGIDELAAMTRLSTSYFSAAFRVSFGTSHTTMSAGDASTTLKSRWRRQISRFAKLPLIAALPTSPISAGFSAA